MNMKIKCKCGIKRGEHKEICPIWRILNIPATTSNLNIHAQFLGKLGGSKTSAKKKLSSKKNGKKGGRPKSIPNL